MKKLFILAAIAFAGTLFAAAPAAAQSKSPHETSVGKNVEVRYGRPYKKGREIFGGLEKFGKVWRTGADSATTITFAKDGTFGGKPVKAGTYTLFTIPNEKSGLLSSIANWVNGVLTSTTNSKIKMYSSNGAC
ncbi:DUF2911 domain-containing protein [Paraflavitalea speifideaquila]|uniref:DUF2911 domain-containing protein n=1 Tax=Paraflavitalea speifideaquila TaxID=3076558 RepID=UPI0028E7F0DF|nr:DUF2911 domain-containing protein [Paraflavitalea speifideiaquila]